MLAYLFWHRPRGGAGGEEYEQAVVAFHRSLQRTPPVGSLGSAAFRLAQAPWSEEEELPLYEDWYLVEDFAALGVINRAAVGRGHRMPHDAAARRSGFGAGALYQLLEGDGGLEGELAVWVSRAPDTRPLELGELLADGMDPSRASLWQRQLVLGPAPEFCLIAHEAPPGVFPTRLPSGWSSRALTRKPIS